MKNSRTLAMGFVGTSLLLLSGCGTNFLSSSGTGLHNTTNQVQANGSRQSHSGSPSKTKPSSGENIPHVTLENVQFTGDSLLLMMTHGTMQKTYANPHLATGHPQQFIVTLQNTSPGKYPVDKAQPLKVAWANNMTMKQSGKNLVLTINLKKSFHDVQSGIGGGDEISFTFQNAAGSPGSSDTDGSSQSRSVMPTLASLDMIDAQLGWGVGHNNVWLGTNGKWTTMTPSGLDFSQNPNVVLAALDKQHVWLAVSDASHNFIRVYHTSTAGQSWHQTKINAIGAILSFQFVDATHGWLMLYQGSTPNTEQVVVYQTSNAGTTWTKISASSSKKGAIPLSGDKNGVAFSTLQRGWITGSAPANGHIEVLQTKDDGKGWSSQNVKVPTTVKGTDLTSNPPIFFGSENAVLPVTVISEGHTGFFVYRTTDGGNTWEPTSVIYSPSISNQFRGWDFINPTTGFVTDGERIYVTTNGGQAWKAIQTNIPLGDVASFDFISKDTGWLLTDSGSVYHTVDGGQHWKQGN